MNTHKTLSEVFSSLELLRLKSSGSVFGKRDAHSTTLLKNKKGSGYYKEI